jgi:hypothetical protein
MAYLGPPPPYYFPNKPAFQPYNSWDDVTRKLNEMYDWYTFMAQKEDALCEKYPTLKSAREQYLIVKAICESEEND